MRKKRWKPVGKINVENERKGEKCLKYDAPKWTTNQEREREKKKIGEKEQKRGPHVGNQVSTSKSEDQASF